MYDLDSRSVVRSLIGLFAFRRNPVSKVYQHRWRNDGILEVTWSTGSLRKNCKRQCYWGVNTWSRAGPIKCRLLIKFANSLDPDPDQQNVVCWLHLQTIWIHFRPDKMSSADYICKQFGSSSGPTKCRLLITFANNLDPVQAQQTVFCWSCLQTV